MFGGDPEVVGGGVFGAAPQHVHVDRGGVFMVGFAAESGVDVDLVAMTAAAHADVGQCAAGGFADRAGTLCRGDSGHNVPYAAM